MSSTRSKIVAQAQYWVGRNEYDDSHVPIIDTYNSHKPLARGYKLKYSDAWCSGFASAVAIACGATDIIPTEVSCHYHVKAFKIMGIWVENDAYVPQPGDFIFYDWQDNGNGDNSGNPDHVGIVEKVENGVITVIEGNYNNAVGRRTLEVNGRCIRGYGVPKYDKDPEKEAEYNHSTFLKELQEALGAPVTGAADLVTLGLTVTVSAKVNANHAAVKPLQKWLCALGYTEVGDADGKAGPKFTSAILHFQQDNGCTTTGALQEWDKTWHKIIFG